MYIFYKSKLKLEKNRKNRKNCYLYFKIIKT